MVGEWPGSIATLVVGEWPRRTIAVVVIGCPDIVVVSVIMWVECVVEGKGVDGWVRPTAAVSQAVVGERSTGCGCATGWWRGSPAWGGECVCA